MRLDMKTRTALPARETMHAQEGERLRQPATLHTRRLQLEPLKEAHADALFPGLSDGALYEFLSECPPENVEALAARFRRFEVGPSRGDRQVWLRWALWSVRSRSHVGVVQARVHPDRSAHLAVVLIHEAWGQRYAREALAATIDHIRDEWGIRDVLATVDVRNHRAIALLAWLGFLRFAVLRSTDMLRCNPSDEYVYLRRLDPSPSSGEARRSRDARRDPVPGALRRRSSLME